MILPGTHEKIFREIVHEVLTQWLGCGDVPADEWEPEATALLRRMNERGMRLATKMPDWLQNAKPDPWTVRQMRRRETRAIEDDQ
jgi:hypothetical protein